MTGAPTGARSGGAEHAYFWSVWGSTTSGGTFLAKAAKGRLTAVEKAGLARMDLANGSQVSAAVLGQPERLVEFLMQRARDELRAMADVFGR